MLGFVAARGTLSSLVLLGFRLAWAPSVRPSVHGLITADLVCFLLSSGCVASAPKGSQRGPSTSVLRRSDGFFASCVCHRPCACVARCASERLQRKSSDVLLPPAHPCVYYLPSLVVPPTCSSSGARPPPLLIAPPSPSSFKNQEHFVSLGFLRPFRRV